GRPEIGRVDADHGFAALCVDAGLVNALTAPFDTAADLGKGKLDQFTHRAGLTGCEHKVVGLVRLKDHMHALDIVIGMAPVAFSFEITEIELVLEPDFDAGDTPRYLARHERLTADRTLVIEQDSITGEHAVGFAIVYCNPITVELCHAIGRSRIEGRSLLLRDLLKQAVEL